jgi:hypothetical protein
VSTPDALLRFLLSLVDNPHSDYDDESEGYPNYRVDQEGAAPVLVVTFYDPEDETTVEARWDLRLVSWTLKDPDDG